MKVPHLAIALFLILSTTANAQEATEEPGMTQAHLHDLILEAGTNVIISGNAVQFEFEGTELLCISDISADRMRIISPIANLAEVGSEQLLLALAANFHSVLDVRYAIGEGIVYSAYIHPLTPLGDEEVLSAISQVAQARNTFGVDYSSGALFFGGGAPKKSKGTDI